MNKQELQRGLEKFLGKNIDNTELQYFIEYFDQVNECHNCDAIAA